MAEDQKIWFVYLTDHHEGPFTLAEVSEKVAAGLVNGQTLSWKDGMAEWSPLETIPDLLAALTPSAPQPQASSTIPAAAPGTSAGDDGGLSLAQMLVQSQGGTVTPTAGTKAPASATASAAVASSVAADEPEENDAVWTLRVGNQVSGLYSMAQLKQMLAAGEIDLNVMLWHSGWTDFQPASQSSLASAAKGKAKTATGTTKKPAARSGLAPITAGANVGDDDVTDPAIQSPGKSGKFAKLHAVLDKVKALFKKKPKAAAAVVAKNTATNTKATVKGKLNPALVKRLAMVLGLVLVLGGAGGAYFFLFSSPIPSSLDVIPDDLEQMKALVKMPQDQGQLYLSNAKGTEEAPVDETNPKYYVATNLPEGTTITMKMTGIPGTLINKLKVEKEFTATVGKNHLAVFESLQDEGKPLPMGEYNLAVSAQGAQELTKKIFYGGRKGAGYERRLKQYKETLQKSYDDEMQELREFVNTLKGMHGDLSKQIAAYKQQWANATMRTKISNDWRSFAANFQPMFAQLETKLKEKATPAPDKTPYYPVVYKDLETMAGQVNQLAAAHNKRMAGEAVNTDDLEGLTQAAISSLEQWLAQAVVKDPMEVLSTGSGTQSILTAPVTGANGTSSGTAPIAPQDPNAAPAGVATPVAPAVPAASPAAPVTPAPATPTNP